MRTTITLSEDVAAGINKVRRERGLGLSEAVNDLIRVGLMDRRERRHIQFPTHDMGIEIDVRDIGEALETIERHDASAG
jgi:metal-responsive CopG/Arc/MetJ family transcriptional regulator